MATRHKPRSSGGSGKSGGMRTHSIGLEELLVHYNYRGGAKRCQRQLVEVFQRYYPRTTIDELVCEPAEALQFFKWACKELAIPLPGRHILRTLLNLRKRKALPDDLQPTPLGSSSTPLFPTDPPA